MMHRLSSRWLVAVLAALLLALAACEAEEEEPEEPADPTEEPDEDDAVDDEEADLTPADGETIVDLLGERAEAPEVDEDAEEPEEPAESSYYATLLEAVEAAELVELLDSEGPFTVFAPTDDAFALQPEDTLEALVDDPDRLAAVLGYHVVEGEVASGELAHDDTFETVSGETLRVVENEAGALTIQGVPIVEPDLEASNGVVHGIAAVMLPPAE